MLFLACLILCLCSNFTCGQVESSGAVASEHSQQVQQGIDSYHKGDLQEAINNWQKALTDAQKSGSAQEQNTIRKYLARAYQQLGQTEEAIAILDQIISTYRKDGDRRSMGRMLSEQAQVYSSIGQNRRAIALLCGKYKERGELKRFDCDKDSALEIARQESDQVGVAAALGSLGNAYRLQGEYKIATQYLEASLEIAQSDPSLHSSALNGLGNVYTSQALRDLRYARVAKTEGDEKSEQKFRQSASGYDRLAIKYFQAMGNIAREQKDNSAVMRSLLNTIVALQRTQTRSSVNHTIEQALIVLENLTDSQEKAYAAIKLASVLQRRPLDSDSPTQCPKSESPQALKLLNQAVATARHIQDSRTYSFALGTLAHVYECRTDYEQALSLTQQAQLVALTPDSLYQWEWQAGRILKAQGRKREAILAYESAVKTLKSIRSDITLANRDLQLDFRDTVEPVYRQLAELWLDSTFTNSNTNSKTDYPLEYLEPALAAIDDLRLAELQNYLGDECELPIIEKPVALLNQNTAVVNSIILKQGIAIILTLPTSNNKFNSLIHWIPADSSQAIKLINDFRLKLEKRTDRANSYKQSARQLYDWIIRPYESDLAAAKIKTLVFIQDGILRSIPMAALDDGKQFLIQKYAIAYTPSLALTDPTPLDLPDRALAFGLTKPAKIDNQTSFPPLSNVTAEIESIQTILPGSKGYLNETFTSDRLQQELENNTYPLLHLATHGKFGIDSRETFLVTGNLLTSNQNATAKSYNETLTMNQLYQLVKSTKSANQIKLLTLSACETAAGSDRDALGIAGIALQAGVQSALASLWQIDDRATTQLIAQFYQGLRDGLTKAEALQATQKAWLEAHPKGRYNHPAYWSPFILIGNWL